MGCMEVTTMQKMTATLTVSIVYELEDEDALNWRWVEKTVIKAIEKAEIGVEVDAEVMSVETA
jgi:hypothetical protein